MRINKKNIKRGFTLTELIIVIVIIGILAAVLVPTITQYVNRARLSNDRSDARNLTMILSLEALEQNVSYFDADYVIATAYENGYDLQASAKGYKYWYDYSNNRLEVLSIEEVASKVGATSGDMVSNPRNKIRNFMGGSYLLVEQGSDEFSTAVNVISNLLELSVELASSNDVSVVVEKMKELFDEQMDLLGTYKTQFEQYSPDKSIYINENGVYTKIAGSTYTFNDLIYAEDKTKPSLKPTTGTSYDEVYNVIISNKTISLPNSAENLKIIFKNDSKVLHNVYIPVNVDANETFKKFMLGINLGSTSTKVVVNSTLQNKKVNELFNELNEKNQFLHTGFTPINIKISVSQNVAPSYNNKLIELNFAVEILKKGLKVNGVIVDESNYSTGIYYNNSFYSDDKYQNGYNVSNQTYIMSAGDPLTEGTFKNSPVYFHSKNNSEVEKSKVIFDFTYINTGIKITATQSGQPTEEFNLGANKNYSAGAITKITFGSDSSYELTDEKELKVISSLDGSEQTVNVSNFLYKDSKLYFSYSYTDADQQSKTHEQNVTFFVVDKKNDFYTGGIYNQAGYFINDNNTSGDDTDDKYYTEGVYIAPAFYEFNVYFKLEHKNGLFVDEKGIFVADHQKYLNEINTTSDLITKGILLNNTFVSETDTLGNLNYQTGIWISNDVVDGQTTVSTGFYSSTVITYKEYYLLVDTINSNSGYVEINSNSSITIMFSNEAGNPIMTEGSSFDVKYYSTSLGNICEVRIFDKYGVLYAIGTLKYIYK